MFKPYRWQRFVLTFVVTAAALAIAGAAVADTIYLKNGRVIRSSSVRVEGDRVIFIQYGGEIAIPMALVDRIEEDATSGPAATPPRPAQSEASDAEAGEAGAAEGADAGADADAEGTPEIRTQDYWQGRIRANIDEAEQVQLQLEDLRRQERAFLFSHRSTAETRRQIETAQQRLAELEQEMADIRNEARQAGVPAGWLRVPTGGEGGGDSGGPGGMSGGSGR